MRLAVYTVLVILHFSTGFSIAQPAATVPPSDPAQESALITSMQRLKTGVNSPANEFAPVLSADGRQLYFARTAHPQNVGPDNKADIWVALKNPDGNWGRALNLGLPINDMQHNIPIGVGKDGETLYYATRAEKGKSITLYFSRNEGRIWAPARKMKFESWPENLILHHAAVHYNGDICFLSAEIPGGLAGRDLYLARRLDDNTWSAPERLPAPVNSPEHETKVQLAADSKTLFFIRNIDSSPPLLWMSRRLDNSWHNWTVPTPFEIDLVTDNALLSWCVTLTGNKIYLGGVQEGQSKDLFLGMLSAEAMPEPSVLLTGRIIDQANRLPVPATVVLRLANSTLVKEKSIDGSYSIVAPLETSLELVASKNGYFSIPSMPVQYNPRTDEELDQFKGSLAELVSPGSEMSGYQLEQLQTALDNIQTDLRELEQKKEKRPLAKTQTKGRKPKAATLSELDQLKQQYENWLRATNPPPGNLQPKGTGEDPELAALKRKFREHNRPVQNDRHAGKPQETEQKQDKELADMKKKFRAYSGTAKEPTLNEGKVPPASFSELETMARLELKREMAPKVQSDIVHSELQGVSRSVTNNLSHTTKELISQEVLRKAYRHTDVLLRHKIDSLPGPAHAGVAENDDLALWKQEVKKLLEKEVRRELKKELAPQVRQELRLELEYAIKKELEASIRTELEIALRKELQDETGSRYFPAGENPGKQPPIIARPEFVRCDIELVPARKGQTLVLEHVLFDADKATLKPESIRHLEQVARFLKDQPGITVEIGGHTNTLCSSTFAQVLSQLRAQTVNEFLVKAGVPGKQLQYQGYGNKFPISQNKNPEDHRKNQRVELKILSLEM